MSYEEFFGKKFTKPGIYIFSDIEKLNQQEKDKLGIFYTKHSVDSRQYYFLNHPKQSLGRFDLLSELRKRDINDFCVYRLNQVPNNFPVFVRKENDHKGSVSPLLNNNEELKEFISSQAIDSNNSDLMIVEFCDTRLSNGFYQKYSSFFVDGLVIPRHIIAGKHWIQKLDTKGSDDFISDELSYLRENPHENQLKKIFSIANIDYGRIDYGLKGDRIQVWEINTNPHILHNFMIGVARSAVHEEFHAKISQAFSNLNKKSPKSMRQMPDMIYTKLRTLSRGLKSPKSATKEQ